MIRYIQLDKRGHKENHRIKVPPGDKEIFLTNRAIGAIMMKGTTIRARRITKKEFDDKAPGVLHGKKIIHWNKNIASTKFYLI